MDADDRGPGGGNEISLDAAALSRVLAHVEEMIVACDGAGVITYASPAVRSELGYDPAVLVGRQLADFLHPDELAEIAEAIERWADRPGAPRGEVQRVRAADGTFVELRYDTVTGEAALPLGDLVLTIRPDREDDPHRSLMLQRLMGEDRIVRLASLFAALDVDRFQEGLDEAMHLLSGLEWVTRLSVWLDDGHRLLRRSMWEASATAPSGTLPESVRADGNWIVRRLAQLEEVHLASVDHLPDDYALERDVLASWGVRSLLAVPMNRGGAFHGFVLAESTFRDSVMDATHTSALRAAASIMSAAFARYDVELELAYRARSDRLTGLPNRWAFADALGQAIDDVQRRLSPGVGVALVDLDRFKLVNDALGHSAGDRLLGDVATRLTGAAPEGTTIARLGGDELMLLHERASTLGDSVAMTRSLLAALAPPFDVDGQPVTLTASAGVVHSSMTGNGGFVADPEELLRRADLAMYRAKGRGGDHVEVDDEALRVTVSKRLQREAELRAAIDGDGLTVHFQAEWNLAADRIIGAEALARWEHPADGLLAAGSFIPMAEECGMIVSLGDRVFEESCRALAGWRRAGLDDDFVLRVNLSAIQLHRGGLVARVTAVMAETGVPPELLCFELTESTLLSDPERSVAMLQELRDLGVGLALDDFGTGFSSMLYLKRLPLTSLKIDRAFVIGLPDDLRDRAIVGSVVELAASLGVSVTAEGVETPMQRQALLDLGCHHAQGFLLSEPEPADDLARRLALG